MALQAGAVDVPDVAQADDPVPFQRLGEHFKGLGLVLVIGQDIGVVAVGDAKEHAVAE